MEPARGRRWDHRSARDYVLQVISIPSWTRKELQGGPIPISAACKTISGDAGRTESQRRGSPFRKNGIPPMHAANPALAIEHATDGIVALIITDEFCARHTTNFGLATTFCSRDGTAPFEKHTNRLLSN